MRKNEVTILVSVLLSLAVCVGGPIGIFFYWLYHDGYHGYTGPHMDLYTVAIKSVPDAEGVIIPGGEEGRQQPVLMLIEEDAYGRKMFCYSEDYWDDAETYLVIAQKSDREYVYYYKDVNFIVGSIHDYRDRMWTHSDRPSEIINPLADFSSKEVWELMIKNDWGKEIQIDKCEQARNIAAFMRPRA